MIDPVNSANFIEQAQQAMVRRDNAQRAAMLQQSQQVLAMIAQAEQNHLDMPNQTGARFATASPVGFQGAMVPQQQHPPMMGTIPILGNGLESQSPMSIPQSSLHSIGPIVMQPASPLHQNLRQSEGIHNSGVMVFGGVQTPDDLIANLHYFGAQPQPTPPVEVLFDITEILEKGKSIGDSTRKPGRTVAVAWPFRNEVVDTKPPTTASAGAGLVFSWFPNQNFQTTLEPNCYWTYVNYASRLTRWKAFVHGKQIGSGAASNDYQRKRGLDLGKKGQPAGKPAPSYPYTYDNCIDGATICKMDVPLFEVSEAAAVAASISPGFPGCTTICVEVKWRLEAFLCLVCPAETIVYGHSQIKVMAEACFDCGTNGLVASDSDSTGFSDEAGDDVDDLTKKQFEKDVAGFGGPWKSIGWK